MPDDPLDLLRRGPVVEDADLTASDDGAVRAALTAGADGHDEPWTLRRCRLTELDLSGVDLTRARMERCTGDGLRLREATLDGLTVVGGTFTGADLAGADLTDATLDDADLSRARLAGALLTDTRFRDCRLVGADLSGLRDLIVSFTVDGCSLALANLSDAHLRGWRLTGVDLSDADLRGADLRDAVLVGSKLRGTELVDARLERADLRGADLGEITADTPRTLRGAVVSAEQAAEICRALGLVVLT